MRLLIAERVLGMCLVLTAAACSTHQVTVAPDPKLRIASSIEVKMQHVPNQYTVEGPVTEQLLKEFSRHLRAELLAEGFEIDPGSPVKLEVDVHAYVPGNAAARILVGFGAGRASLLYTARYVGQNGEVLAQLDGQQRHTGTEVYGIGESRHGAFAGFAGAEKAREILMMEASRRIVSVLQMDGR